MGFCSAVCEDCPGLMRLFLHRDIHFYSVAKVSLLEIFSLKIHHVH